MVPAIVKFVGDEKEYIRPCGEYAVRYCNICETAEVCTKKENQPKWFTYGKEYKAHIVEYWEGVRNGLYVTNDITDYYEGFIPAEDFEVVCDPDNVLNDYEAEVKCISSEYDTLFELGFGKTYKAIGQDKYGYYLIMDETKCCYFYPAEDFEIVSDPHDILSHVSLLMCYGGGADDDCVSAHRWSCNHKPELSKDNICGCFYCMKIFNPTEIEEWIVDDNPADQRGTAICPYCGIDSVVGESSGFPITQELLAGMNDRWFNK